MIDMLYIGGPMHRKRWTGRHLPTHVPVDIVDKLPLVCHMRPKDGMRAVCCGEYLAVLPDYKMHTEMYETRIALIRGREVPYLSYKGVA